MIQIQQALTQGGVQYQNSEFFLNSSEIINIIGSSYYKFPLNVRDSADATLGFRSQPGLARIQSMGTTTRLMSEGPVSDRLMRVQDPDDASKFCWLMQAHMNDPDTASSGAKRAEFSYSKTAIKEGQPFVIGYKARVNDYLTATDRFLFLQIHGPSGTDTPPFGVYIRNNGMRIVNQGPDAISRNHYHAPYTPNQWMSFVFRCVMSPSENGSFECWLNGNKIIDHTGSFGYEQIDGSYLKSGIYQWTSETNIWDNNFPMKTIYAKGPYLVDGADVESMGVFLEQL